MNVYCSKAKDLKLVVVQFPEKNAWQISIFNLMFGTIIVGIIGLIMILIIENLINIHY